MSNILFDLAFGDNETIYAGCQNGLIISKDSGQSWQNGLSSLELETDLTITAVATSPNYVNDQTVFIASSGTILCSDNGGDSWQASRLANPAPIISKIALSPNFSNDQTVFATSIEDGVFVSRNGGIKWSSWNFGLYDQHVNCISISNQYETNQTIWIGTESNVFQSSNGGRAWQSLDFPMASVPVTVIFEHNEQIIVGCAEGLFGWNEKVWQLVSSFTKQVTAIFATNQNYVIVGDEVAYQVPQKELSVESAWRPIKQGRGATAVAVSSSGKIAFGSRDDDISVVEKVDFSAPLFVDNQIML